MEEKKEFKNLRIAVGGPPHSGKSVLLAKLYEVLPSRYTFCIRACPDGEGMWSQNNKKIKREEKREIDLVKTVRKKGVFNHRFVHTVINQIEDANIEMLLIDLGGIRSKENEEIIKHCNSFIIVSNDKDEAKKWQEWVEGNGVECIGVLNSVLDGSDSIEFREPYLSGTVSGLERGNNTPSLMINALATKILEERTKKINISRYSSFYEDDEILDMETVAKKFNYLNEAGKANWNEKDLKEILTFIKKATYNKDTVKVTGARPNWLTCAISDTIYNNEYEIENDRFFDKKRSKKDVSFYDALTDTYVEVGDIKTSENFENDILDSYYEESDDSILLHVDIKNWPLKAEEMKQIVLPKLDETKKFYLSGRIPNYLAASIMHAYNGFVDKNILQPGKGFIKIASKDENMLGSIEMEPNGIDIEEFFENSKNKAKKEEGPVI